MATLLSSRREDFDGEAKTQKEFQLEDGSRIVLRKKIVTDKITGVETRSFYDLVQTLTNGEFIRKVIINSDGGTHEFEYRGNKEKAKLYDYKSYGVKGK